VSDPAGQRAATRARELAFLQLGPDENPEEYEKLGY
jgi:hypothetical protein